MTIYFHNHAGQAYATAASSFNPLDDLKMIVEKAKSTKSSSFLFIKNGQVLVNLNSEEKPINSQSITKSITSLGIGILIDQGKIASVDQLLSEWYPEWADDPRGKITIRHLLTHTSGLEPEASAEEIDRADDCIEFALSANLLNPPGTTFAYNNKAVNLLSGIIERTTGKKVDIWMQENLFGPLQISNASYDLDRNGHVYSNAGLKIQATDLAKLGQLLLNEGNYNGVQLISREWLKESMHPQNPEISSCGFLWWIWESPTKAYAATGYGGQYLIMIPQFNIIVVRQTEDLSDPAHFFNDLPELLFEYCKRDL